MRILLAPVAGGVGLGPLTNVLAIAEEAIAKGHDVGFVCKGAWITYIKDLGYEVYEAPTPDAYNGKLPPPYRLSDVAIGLGWTEEGYIRNSINAELQAIRSFSADVIVSESSLTAPISATIAGKPSTSVCYWADGPEFTSPLYQQKNDYKDEEANFNRVFKEFGIPPIKDICELAFLRSELKIAPSIPELEPELLTLKNIHFVGSLLSDDMEGGELPSEIEEWQKDSSIIYVYLTPGDIKPEFWIPTLIKTFDNTKYHVIVPLAPLNINPQSLPISRNVHFYKRLPGKTAIRCADLVITHGGANTVANALMCGKPQLIYPDLYAERDYNGRAIVRLGAGLNLSTDQFNPIKIIEDVKTVLTDDRYRQNAARIGNIVKTYKGSKEFIRLIESEL